MQDYIYASLSMVAIVIHIIINYDLLIGRAGVNAKANHYRGFLLGVLSYYVADIAWGILAGLVWTRALYYETIFYFLSLAMIAIEWTKFVCSYLRLKGWQKRFLVWFGYAFLAFDIVMLTVNFFNDCFYSFDHEGRYVIGTCRNISFTMQFMLNSIAALFTLIAVFRSKGVARWRNLLVFLLGFTMTISFVAQVAWPLCPFTALGCLIGICFFHVFVIEVERDEKRAALIEREQAVKHMAELEAALARAIAAEKSRNTFFSIVSHDIRTPLNAILGYSELLEHGLKTEEEKEEALKSIHSSGTTLLQLVNDVLDFAKMDSGRMNLTLGPVKLGELTDDVFASFKLAASTKGLKLANKIGQVPALMLDEHRFRQMLFNFIGNALKFTNEGSVTVDASYSEGRLELSVADTGIGIAPEMLPRIFDPFVQVHDQTHPVLRTAGSGLGLSICKRLVNLMGGDITVESEPWKGTTFRVSIPQVAIAEVKVKTDGKPKVAVSLAELPKHVLVVDDSPVNCSVLKAFLRRVGVENVDFAGDGGEALEKLHAGVSSGTPYDFVLTDYWMPKVNGLELAGRIREESNMADLSVYVVTADAELLNDDKARQLFTGVLLKPVTYDSLLDVFRKERPKA